MARQRHLLFQHRRLLVRIDETLPLLGLLLTQPFIPGLVLPAPQQPHTASLAARLCSLGCTQMSPTLALDASPKAPVFHLLFFYYYY